MKILSVADTPAETLCERFDPERWEKENIDLIVGCGDLPDEYLAFLADVFRVPLLYVRGNHDEHRFAEPIGENVDGKIVTIGGVRLLGLEGSPWYNGRPLQYSERSMAWKLLCLEPKIRLAGGVDVVIAHAAPQFCPSAYQLCPKPVGVGRPCPHVKQPMASEPHICQDASDYPHRGFESFRTFILRHQPRFFLHGHRHQTYGLGKRELRIGETRVVDAHGHVVLDV